MNATIIWLIAAVCFALLEAATVQLVSIWFAVGSLAGMVTAALRGPVWLQFVLFCAVSLLVLVIVRPSAKRYLTPRKTATNADRVIGMTGIVTQTIDPMESAGLVAVGGSVWTARSDSGIVIPEGTQVQALRIEGVKLIVMPLVQTPLETAGSRKTTV